MVTIVREEVMKLYTVELTNVEGQKPWDWTVFGKSTQRRLAA
jgi:hypothetical protein